MKKLLIFIFLLIGSYSYSENFNLKSNFLSLPEGSYLVLQNKDLYTLFHILNQEKEKARVQEVSISKKTFDSLEFSWSTWIKKGFTKHGSHLIYTMDKGDGHLGDIYQADENIWTSSQGYNSFLQTLLNLEFQKVADYKRKKIGHPPDGFRVDDRPFWSPKVIYEGEPYQGILFNELKSQWPQDGSDFAGISIHLFLPQEGQLPLQLPYWISFQDSAFYQIIRTVDAGINIHSDNQELP